MAGEYNINLSNGTVLSALHPLETNGPDNRSVPRLIQDVRPQFQVDATNATTDTFSVIGDFTTIFRTSQTFEVVGSTGNNGTYTVQSSSFSTGSTHIITNEDFVDGTADGDIIAHVFILSGDLVYRFIPTFEFDVTNSAEVDGTYTVTTEGAVLNGDTTIIPVTHGSIRDNLIASIALPYGQIDYFITDSNTALKLPGRGVMNYGEMIIENMVRITENFAADLPPNLNPSIGTQPVGDPLIGQLWYNTTIGQEGFSHYDGTIWTNQLDVDNGVLIFRDPQNTTTANSDIYLTGDESGLPAGYIGTIESGMVIWNEVNPIAQDAILRVMSVDGTENLRVEHDGYVRTSNNLEVIGGGNGTTESYFHGQVGIGDNGLPTIERTLTVEGDGITVNSDTGLHAGLTLDCPSITEQSVIEFEVANELISSIHTETNIRTLWESPTEATTDTNSFTIQTGSTTSGANTGEIRLITGLNDSGGSSGPVVIQTGQSTVSADTGGIILNPGSNTGTGEAGGVGITGGFSAVSSAGSCTMYGGGTTSGYGGHVVLFGGSGDAPGDVKINGGTASTDQGGDVQIIGGRSTGGGLGGPIWMTAGIGDSNSGGEIAITGGASGTVGNGGDVDIFSGYSGNLTGWTGNIGIQTKDTSRGSRTGGVTLGTGNIDTTISGLTANYNSGGLSFVTGSLVSPKEHGNSGSVTLSTGSVGVSDGASGSITLQTGGATTLGEAGTINIVAGTNGSSNNSPGAAINITGGVSGGSGTAGRGGDVVLTGGAGVNTAIDGFILLQSDTRVTGNVGINKEAPSGTVDLDVIGDIQSGTQMLVPVSGPGEPTYSFTANEDTGMSLVGTTLHFDVGGSSFLNIETNGSINVTATNYETLVDNDDVLTNKKYVDDAIRPHYEEYSASGGEVIVNTTIPTIANTGSPGLATMQVFLNGIFQMEGATKNYTVTGANQITFNVALVATDDVVIYSFNR